MWLIKEYFLIIKLHIDNFIHPKPPKEWKGGNKGDVILIHGLHENYNFLRTIGNQLNKRGYKIHVLKDLKRNTLSVKKGSKILGNYIDDNNLKKIYIVCHSKGTLISKYFLVNSNQSKIVIKIISIASAINGSYLAFLAPGFYKDLLPFSRLIKKLNKNTTQNSKFINLYPKVDNHVIPNKYLLIPKAINIKVDIKGHTRILTSDKTLNIIDKYL